jgi:hypothetical protein
MTVSAHETAEHVGGTASADWIGPTLERVAKAFAVTAPRDGGRARAAAAYKIEWPPDILLADKMIETEDHAAAQQLARDYGYGYGSQSVVGNYGEPAGAGVALVFDRRLGTVTHHKGMDLGRRMWQRARFDRAIRALEGHQQALVVAALTAVCGLSPLDGSPFMSFTRLGEWYVPPVTNPKQRAMAGKILVKLTCETLRAHYDAA